MMESKLFRREVDVILTVQAQRVLSQSNFSEDEFVEWALHDHKFSLGGNNVALFLEDMAVKKRVN